MQKAQMILQKILMGAAVAVAAATFFYALGFATDLYSLSYHTDASSSLLYVPGAELYYQIQPYNRELLRNALILLMLSVLLFATLTHRRRLYYASNYAASVLWAGFAGYVSLTNYVNAAYIKGKYLLVDFERLQKVTKMLKMRYVESTFMMDCGMVLSGLLLAVALGLLVNLALKTIWMQRERRLLVKEAAA